MFIAEYHVCESSMSMENTDVEGPPIAAAAVELGLPKSKALLCRDTEKK
jgi:hypothetical protein